MTNDFLKYQRETSRGQDRPGQGQINYNDIGGLPDL